MPHVKTQLFFMVPSCSESRTFPEHVHVDLIKIIFMNETSTSLIDLSCAETIRCSVDECDANSCNVKCAIPWKSDIVDIGPIKLRKFNFRKFRCCRLMVYPPPHRRSPIMHGTNRVWHSATALIATNALPLSQTANQEEGIVRRAARVVVINKHFV